MFQIRRIADSGVAARERMPVTEYPRIMALPPVVPLVSRSTSDGDGDSRIVD